MNTIAKPFGILLMFLYELVQNYGVAVFLFALVIKVVLLPFQMKSKRSMMQSSRLQPKIKELEKKHGANKAKYNEEIAKLYREEGVNPASGCLWSFLPLPIMIALFYAIRQPLTIMMGVASELLQEGGAILTKLQELGFESAVTSYYTEIAQSQFISAHFDQFAGLSEQLRRIDFSFIGIDLGAQPQWNFLWSTDWSNSAVWLPGLALFIIPFLSGAAQMLATKVSTGMNPAAAPEGQAGSMKTMMMMMPLISVYFAFVTPGALGFYWTLSALLQMAQDIWLTKRYTKIIDAEDAVKAEERKRKEAELEQKRIETERKKAEGIAERNPNTSKRKREVTEKQEQQEKAAQWQKRNAPPAEEEPSREGHRRYARGRAYDPDRYAKTEEAAEKPDERKEEDAELEIITPELTEGEQPQDADETEEETTEQNTEEE